MRTLLIFCTLLCLLGCKHSKEHHQEENHRPAPEDHHNHGAHKDQTVYYLIRHAEKDRSNPDNKDPELTETGQARALVWASHFEDKILDYIYSSDYARTRQTAQPTANSKRMEVLLYEPGKLYGEEFLEKTVNKRVLIVGHSNTIPALVNDLIGSEDFEDMDDTDNASIFIVTIRQGEAMASRMSIELP